VNARRTGKKQAAIKKTDAPVAPPTAADNLRPTPRPWQKLALTAATILLACWLIVLVLLARR
jgi:hypothetical protein